MNNLSIFDIKLSDSTFQKLSKIAYSVSGIKLTAPKKIMVESRLRKRLKALNLRSYEEYLNLLENSNNSEELVHFINSISTNKTEFFREARHFEIMKNLIIEKRKYSSQHQFTIWSAACSTGEEPYSIAISIEELKISEKLLDVNYRILASDISTGALEKAYLGIYEKERLINVDTVKLKKYFMKSKKKDSDLYRVVPEIREKIAFRRINLKTDYKLDEEFDFIFCRNVLIYFDRKTQLEIVDRIIRYLKIGGILFLGHSEALFELRDKLKQIAPSSYIKGR